jgi:single-strand DNA-binding protein
VAGARGGVGGGGGGGGAGFGGGQEGAERGAGAWGGFDFQASIVGGDDGEGLGQAESLVAWAGAEVGIEDAADDVRGHAFSGVGDFHRDDGR